MARVLDFEDLVSIPHFIERFLCDYEYFRTRFTTIFIASCLNLYFSFPSVKCQMH